MGSRQKLVFLVATTLVVGSPATGRTPSPAVSAPAAPAVISQLVGCRTIGDTAQRLACFDRESARADAALKRAELVVVDRETVRNTKRSLFGLAMPNLKIFGDGDAEALKQIDGTIAAISMNRDGGYVFSLADESRWTQIDDRPIALEPRSGDKVLIKKASMGSYMLSVGHQPGVRVRRTN